MDKEKSPSAICRAEIAVNEGRLVGVRGRPDLLNSKSLDVLILRVKTLVLMNVKVTTAVLFQMVLIYLDNFIVKYVNDLKTELNHKHLCASPDSLRKFMSKQKKKIRLKKERLIKEVRDKAENYENFYPFMVKFVKIFFFAHFSIFLILIYLQYYIFLKLIL
jgi:ABC-type protease/lipase transport system fused ATPase/permease subunit